VSYLSDPDLGQLPRHVGIIMDGNGRWAKQRGLTRSDGHSAGEEALFDVVDASIEIGLKWLTVYAFSTENWKRPPTEIRYLMYFNRRLLRNRRDELNGRGVRIRFTGRNDWRVPRNVDRDMTDAQDLTRANTGLTFTIAFNYGGRTEIVDAVHKLLDDHDKGRLKGERLTPDSIRSRMYYPDMPDLDLLIRTGGEMRISNFLVWQAAYSELWFTPVYWPDFNRELLFEAIRDYQKRDRRFGGVPDA